MAGFNRKRDPDRMAAAYLRMSTDHQDESPEQQREHVVRLAARLGLEIVRWYVDAAISGDDTPRRLGFKQMFADALAGQFGTIVCWSLDRFGRFDSIDAGEWVGRSGAPA